MYPFQGCENLQIRNEMELSEERKTFSQFFVAFLECSSNFEHFERKDDRHR